MMTRLHRAGVAVAMLVGVLVGAPATHAPPAAATAPSIEHVPAALKTFECSASVGKGTFDYDGAAASSVYDTRFAGGPHIPHLRNYVPQGLAYWADRGWILISAYPMDSGDDSLIIAVNAGTGRHVGTVRIYGDHVGGIAVGSSFVYVSETSSFGTSWVQRYGRARLARNLKRSGTPYVTYTAPRESVRVSSFVAAHGGKLWLGKFDERDQNWMYRYEINGNGAVGKRVGKRVWVPKKAQGVAITDGHFYFSTSFDRDNRSNIYVKNRRSGKTRCFRAPSMSQGITKVGNRIYVNYESGSRKYNGARNEIEHLHRTPKRRLDSLVD